MQILQKNLRCPTQREWIKQH